MKLYSGSVAQFSTDIDRERLLPKMQTEFARQVLHQPSASEVTSWAHSLPVLRDDLLTADLSEAGVILESMLPLSSRRLDAIVLGRDDDSRARSVVIELKQWRRADVISVQDRLVDLGGRLILHPQQQVAQYVGYLRDFHSLVELERLTIDGVAYLHNATVPDRLAMDLTEISELDDFPLFTGDDRVGLQSYLSKRTGSGDGEAVVREYLAAPMKPSQKLLEHVALEIDGQPMFHLLDEQMVAFEIVKKAVQTSRARIGGKLTVIVTGGPGTGKSVIAIRLLGWAAQQKLSVSHATGSKSFTETMRQIVGRRAAEVFRYFNSFSQAEKDELDLLVCDEAHRIRVTSNSRFTRRELRSSLPQADELIQVAKVPVFLLDQNQVVRPEEIGTVEAIEDAARRNGSDVIRIDLNSQFRCMGSEKYIRWVESLLQIAADAPLPWDKEGEDFELVVADNPFSLEKWLAAKHGQGWTARIAAGFCWPWSDPDPDGNLVNDVTIGDWRRPWNLRQNKRAREIPSASYWASDPRGFGQVGCIYTAQGFEYDFGGVIFGPDLVWRTGRWVADQQMSRDSIARSAQHFDELVRNVYKVLLTRGLRGCGVYSTDPETQSLLEELIPQSA